MSNVYDTDGNDFAILVLAVALVDPEDLAHVIGGSAEGSLILRIGAWRFDLQHTCELFKHLHHA